MSDDDWSDNENDTRQDEEDDFVMQRGANNVWNNYNVGLNTEHVNEKVVSDDKKVDTNKVESGFANDFLENLNIVNTKFFEKMASNQKKSTIVPTYWLLEQFKEDEDFYEGLKLARSEFDDISTSKSLKIQEKGVTLKTKWKTKFKKVVKQKKFKHLGIKTLKQATEKIDFMKNTNLDLQYGKHYWDNNHFTSLKLDLDDKKTCIYFLIPSKKGKDSFKAFEKVVIKKNLNTIALLEKEQENVKIKEVLIPKLQISEKIDFTSYLKRLGVDAKGINCSINIELKSTGVSDPVAAKIKTKQTYRFFKSELGRPLHNVDEFPFCLDSSFIFFVADKDSEAIFLTGKIITSQ